MKQNSVADMWVSYIDQTYLKITECECCTLFICMFFYMYVMISSKHREAPGKCSFWTCSCYTISFPNSIFSTTHTQMLFHIVQCQLHTQVFLFSYFCMSFGYHACICSLQVMNISIWGIQTPVEVTLQYL